MITQETLITRLNTAISNYQVVREDFNTIRPTLAVLDKAIAQSQWEWETPLSAAGLTLAYLHLNPVDFMAMTALWATYKLCRYYFPVAHVSEQRFLDDAGLEEIRNKIITRFIITHSLSPRLNHALEEIQVIENVTSAKREQLKTYTEQLPELINAYAYPNHLWQALDTLNPLLLLTNGILLLRYENSIARNIVIGADAVGAVVNFLVPIFNETNDVTEQLQAESRKLQQGTSSLQALQRKQNP